MRVSTLSDIASKIWIQCSEKSIYNECQNCSKIYWNRLKHFFKNVKHFIHPDKIIKLNILKNKWWMKKLQLEKKNHDL